MNDPLEMKDVINDDWFEKATPYEIEMVLDILTKAGY
jgi:hypothetical protein